MHIETENKLIEKNTRPTAMRIMMYNFLKEQDSALSLSEIEESFENADRTTLYRTLKTFEEKGIVHSIQESHTTRYMICADHCDEESHNDWHLHFYCKVCKQTTCREDFVIPNNFNLNLQIDSIQLFATGICENCKAGSLQ